METDIKISEKGKIKVKTPKHYKVVMHNDDFTTMEFVVDVLTGVFNKTIEDANKIMLDVHEKGMGIVGVYPFDIAKTKVSYALNLAKEEGFPFNITVEEE